MTLAILISLGTKYSARSKRDLGMASFTSQKFVGFAFQREIPGFMRFGGQRRTFVIFAAEGPFGVDT